MSTLNYLKIKVLDDAPDDMVALVGQNSGVMLINGQQVKFVWDDLRWTGEKVEAINVRIVEIDGQPVKDETRNDKI